MGSLSEHAAAIRAAIEAAEADGFWLECGFNYAPNGDVESVDLDLWNNATWVTVWTEDRA